MAKNIDDLINFATSTASIERYPTPANRLVKGTPEQINQTHFNVGDNFIVGEWGSEVGCWKTKYTENEFVYIISGKVILRDIDGREMMLQAGDKVCIPAGFEGEWEIVEAAKKIYAIYEA